MAPTFYEKHIDLLRNERPIAAVIGQPEEPFEETLRYERWKVPFRLVA